MNASLVWSLWVTVLTVGAIGCAKTQTAAPKAPLIGIAGPVIVAHRGGALEAPENTLAACRHGIAAGADWLEIDVTLSADDQVVVIHDDTLERTTDGRGAVRDHTLAQLRKLHAGQPTWNEAGRQRLASLQVGLPDFGERFVDETVPTLAEVLALADARVMVELKKIESDKVKELARRVMEAVREAAAYDRVIVGSFQADLLWAVYDLEPSQPLIGIVDSEAAYRELLNLPIVAMAVSADLVELAVREAPPGLAVWGYTAYNVEMAEKMALRKAAGIITDVPAAVVRTLRRKVPLYIEPDKGGHRE